MFLNITGDEFRILYICILYTIMYIGTGLNWNILLYQHNKINKFMFVERVCIHIQHKTIKYYPEV